MSTIPELTIVTLHQAVPELHSRHQEVAGSVTVLQIFYYARRHLYELLLYVWGGGGLKRATLSFTYIVSKKHKCVISKWPPAPSLIHVSLFFLYPSLKKIMSPLHNILKLNPS